MKVVGTSREQMDSGDHGSVDIDKLVESVEGKLKMMRSFPDQCSIYRVPQRLRELNEKAYTPRVISIGPLHYGKEELKEMEEHKRLYLRQFLEFSKVSVKDFIAAIIEKETRLRNSYAVIFDNLSKEEFAEMVLLDSSFLIMLLLKSSFSHFQSSNIDCMFNNQNMDDELRSDLCLLENQLPFFIVEDLFKLSKIPCEYSLIKLTHALLLFQWDQWVPENLLESINLSKAEHFVDFLRICQQPEQHMQSKKLATLTTPSAAELHEAGIKFKLGSSINLLNIKFDRNKGMLEIPLLRIHGRTGILFRNLQAFEECNYGSNFYVCNYITMLSLLVPSAKDVEILVKNGILENWLSDNNAVSSLVQSISKESFIDMDDFYFSDVVEDLNNYYRKRGPRWKAALKQKYFQNPWTVISVVAAAVLLLLTIIQTVCSIIQVS